MVLRLQAEIDRHETKQPAYRQIYQRVVALISTGQLPPGGRLPAIRTLAHELGLAQGTVEAAYDLLSAEGYIIAKGAAGTFVSAHLPLRVPTVEAPAEMAEVMEVTADPNRTAQALPLQMGLPALDAFPTKLWARLSTKRMQAWAAADLAYPPAAGYAPLRTELAKYLRLARGIVCRPEQIVVVAGYQAALALLAQLFGVANRQVWLEDPGYVFGRAAWLQAGAEIVPVPVDEEGLCVAAGLALAPTACCAVVTPAHQSPLTVSLSLARRLALLDWAARTGGWVIEDDYDGEYRYRGWPLPALSSLDQAERCITVGTLSKVLFPGLRLAYVALPPALVAPAEQVLQHSSYSPALLGQQVLTDFMQAGHFSRHIKKMRRLYAERRTMVMTVFQQRLSPWLNIAAEAGGMHLVAKVQPPYRDVWLAERAQAQGMAVQALSHWAIAPAQAQQGLLFGFANVVDTAQAQAYAEALAQAWASADA